MRELCLYQDTTNVTPFQFENHQIRAGHLDGEPGFVARDVATALGYTNPQKAVRDHCKAARPLGDERFVHPSLDPQTIIIPEFDVYRLIMRSKLPSAERFEEWVVGEVLPSIRKTGSYGLAVEQLNDPASLRRLLGNYTERVEQLERQIETDKPKVDFYDSYASMDGQFGLQQAARVLGEGPVKFVKWLKRKRFLFKEGGVAVPYARYVSQGLFKVTTVIGNDRARARTVITPKGIQYFAKKLAAEKFEHLAKLQPILPGIIN